MCWPRHIYAAGYIDRKLAHRRKHAKTSDVVQPRMDKSSRDSFHGFCTLCRCDFDISSQGKAAIERHAGIPCVSLLCLVLVCITVRYGDLSSLC